MLETAAPYLDEKILIPLATDRRYMQARYNILDGHDLKLIDENKPREKPSIHRMIPTLNAATMSYEDVALGYHYNEKYEIDGFFLGLKRFDSEKREAILFDPEAVSGSPLSTLIMRGISLFDDHLRAEKAGLRAKAERIMDEKPRNEALLGLKSVPDGIANIDRLRSMFYKAAEKN